MDDILKRRGRFWHIRRSVKGRRDAALLHTGSIRKLRDAER